MLDVRLGLPGHEELSLTIEPSHLLFQIDRQAYIEALEAADEADKASDPDEPETDEEVA